MVYLHCFPSLHAPWKQSSSLSVLPGLLNKNLKDSWATIHASYFKPLSLGEGVVTEQELTSTSYFSPIQSISRVQLFAPYGLQHTRLPCLSQSPCLHKFAQTHVHWVGDAIQPSHPLSSPSPPTFNLSQHEGLFQWVSSLHQVAKVLEFQLQHQSFPWIFRTDFL